MFIVHIQLNVISYLPLALKKSHVFLQSFVTSHKHLNFTSSLVNAVNSVENSLKAFRGKTYICLSETFW